MMNEDDVNQNASKGEADSGAGASSTALRKLRAAPENSAGGAKTAADRKGKSGRSEIHA